MHIGAPLSIPFSIAQPVLPSVTGMQISLHLVWAVVLGSGALLAMQKFPRAYRLSFSLLILSWTLLPGAVSPAYWLGLAFQTPSLSSAVICLIWVWHAPGVRTLTLKYHVSNPDALRPTAPYSATGTPGMAGLCGIALGWLLLLDTMAWWSMSVYAWGFGCVALAMVAILTTLAWVVLGVGRSGQPNARSIELIPIFAVLTLFVLTRWPSGNVWDALLDPWLWIALQVRWLSRYW
jgi:hypothetical protein